MGGWGRHLDCAVGKAKDELVGLHRIAKMHGSRCVKDRVETDFLKIFVLLR